MSNEIMSEKCVCRDFHRWVVSTQQHSAETNYRVMAANRGVAPQLQPLLNVYRAPN